ncbi:MAG: ROK family protein [Bacteroidales bacterium]|nr:ROK family protein [Bacteroidales bacterium]
MQTFLGLDLGGTKLLIGEVDAQGNVLRSKSYVSGFLDQQAACEVLCRSLDDYIATVGWATGEPPQAMGVGLIGRVDPYAGIWHQIDPGRTQPVNLAEMLAARYGLPCRIDNDVKSATRAEQVWGVGKQSKDFVFINIGTGIAAGTVTDGRIVRGGHFNAGEVGHTQVGAGVGIRCVCGRTDCVEAFASGSGIDRCARFLQRQYRTALPIPVDGTPVKFSDVLALSKEGDPLCSFLVENAADGIARLIMNLVRMSDPDTVVLGGGVIAQETMLERVLAHLHPSTMRFVSRGVVLTELDPRYAGLLGAAAVAMDATSH